MKNVVKPPHFKETIMENIRTCDLCHELEKRPGVQRIVVKDGKSLEIKGDGETKEIAEPVLTGPAIVYVVTD